jgi:hypothetical protein
MRQGFKRNPAVVFYQADGFGRLAVDLYGCAFKINPFTAYLM